MSPASSLVRPRSPISLLGLEIATSIGLDARTTRAEVTAGTLRFAETEVGDAAGQPARAARLTVIPTAASRIERIVALATHAFRAHLDALLEELELEGRVPLYLALPPPDDAGPVDFPRLQDALEVVRADRAPRLTLELSSDQLARQGRAGFFHALAAAVSRVDAGDCRCAIAGAADSLCDAGSLRRLSAANRLLGDANRDGLIPGEAAGFVLVAGPRVRTRAVEGPLELDAISLAREPRPFVQEEPSLAAGLTESFRALRERQAQRLDVVVAGQPGEAFWAEEFSRAYLRNAPWMPEPLVTRLVAASVGDVGAAAGVMGMLIAAGHWRDGGAAKSQGPRRALVYACSDEGPIGACVLRQAGAPAQPGRAAVVRVRPPEPERDQLSRELGFLHACEIGFLLEHRVAILGNPRRSWMDAADAERRAFDHLRAIEAWGSDPQAAHAEGLLTDEIEAVRGAAFAIAGSVGDDGNEALARCLEAALDGEETQTAERAAAWLTSLCHAENPRLREVLEALAERGSPRIQALAVEALGYRREARVESLGPVVSSKDAPAAIREAAALALARARVDGARAAVERALLEHPASAALMRAATWLGSPLGRECAQHALSGEGPHDGAIALALASCGEPSDAALLSRFAPADPASEARLCEAMGVLGAPGLVPLLLAKLSAAGDAAIRRSAAEALDRLTGAGLPPLSAEVGEDGDDLEPERISLDAGEWSAWWTANQGRFGSAERYRHGAPFTTERCLDELRSPRTLRADRAAALEELRARSPSAPAMEVDDFVARQRSALDGEVRR